MRIWVGEVGVDLQFTVEDAGSAYDLTSATVTLMLSDHLDMTCTLVSPTQGTCKYTTATGDFDTAGKHVAQLKIEKGSNIYYTGRFELTIRALIQG